MRSQGHLGPQELLLFVEKRLYDASIFFYSCLLSRRLNFLLVLHFLTSSTAAAALAPLDNKRSSRRRPHLPGDCRQDVQQSFSSEHCWSECVWRNVGGLAPFPKQTHWFRTMPCCRFARTTGINTHNTEFDISRRMSHVVITSLRDLLHMGEAIRAIRLHQI